MGLLRNRFEEVERVVVVDDVGSLEFEYIRLFGVFSFGSGFVDFWVFNNVGFFVFGKNEINRFGSIVFVDDFGSYVDVFVGREVNEDRVSNFYKVVVYIVGMDVLDIMFVYVVNCIREN